MLVLSSSKTYLTADLSVLYTIKKPILSLTNMHVSLSRWSCRHLF